MDGDWAKVYAACPIVCKLADFGLSRSPDMQTTSFLQTRTNQLAVVLLYSWHPRPI